MIVRDGLRRMCEEQEDVFYYLTVMNENYVQPALPEGVGGGDPARDLPPARRDGRRAARAAARLRRDPPRGDRRRRPARGRLRHRERRLERDELHGAAPRRARGGALEPPPPDRRAAALVRARRRSRAAAGRSSPRPTTCARSPTRSGRSCRAATPCSARTASGAATTAAKLRQFFEVDRHHVAVTALKALADEGVVEPAVVQDAIERYGIDADVDAPWKR